MLKQILAILTIGTFAGTGAAVAGHNTGATLSKDGHVTYVRPPAYPSSAPPRILPLRLRTIFSNFNLRYPYGLYWCCAGLTVSGSNAGFDSTINDGVRFSPAANARVTEIDAAVGSIKGRSKILFSIYTDRNGIPGRSLGLFYANNVLQYGACCALAVGTGNPIRLRAGRQYWFVVSTGAPDSDTWASWSFNSVDDLTGMLTTSTNPQGQWQPGRIFAPVPAFAIYGR